MSDREEIRSRMSQDGIEFLLAQFVDMHGSAKVKMVPVSSFDAAIDEGAGFAGAAVWGMGQGPHAHDMMARIDLDSYTPLPWMPNTARFAADLFVDGESHPYCPRTNLKRVLAQVREAGSFSMWAWSPNIFWSRATRTDRSNPGTRRASTSCPNPAMTSVLWRRPWPICRN